MPKLLPFVFATALVTTCAAVDGQGPTATRLACTTATFADLSNVTSVEVATVPGAMLNATNPDLKPFNAKGGKLIVWHGWGGPGAVGAGHDSIPRTGARA